MKASVVSQAENSGFALAAGFAESLLTSLLSEGLNEARIIDPPFRPYSFSLCGGAGSTIDEPQGGDVVGDSKTKMFPSLSAGHMPPLSESTAVGFCVYFCSFDCY